jgi:2',3'-cyclic-nucleotide 2'-phosphodiesterase/3'-nucleotidase
MAAGILLRIIGTSDLHAYLYPYDYYRDRPDETVGLAKTAALIAAARAESANALLLDNGDFLQGAPLGDWAARSMRADKSAVHPVIASMNELEYAVGTLGNHEFNYGLDVLEAALRGAAFPFVNCNILRPDRSLYFQPWVISERSLLDEAGAPRRLRVGVIGFVTPQIVQWDRSHLAGRVTTIGIVEAARIHVPELRRRGADIVIALCHSGLSRKAGPSAEENAALALAEVEGIDAILLGHQHLVLPGSDFHGVEGVDAVEGALNGVPAFMPGFFGSHLGVIDLSLFECETGWRVGRAKVEARPIYLRDGDAVIPKAAAHPRLLEIGRPAHEATLAYVRAPVGQITAPIHSYFALIADDPSVQIVNAAQRWYVGRLGESVPVLPGLPILSAAAPFKCGGRGGPDYYTDVAAGPIAIKDVANLYVYPNDLRVVKINGAALAEWLERSASLFLRIDPKSRERQPLLDSAFAAYDFDVVAGVTYAIDVTQRARYDGDGELVAADSNRIVDLAFHGEPVDPLREFLLVTNSYRANGGGHFPGCDGSNIVYEGPDANRDVLLRYIVETGRVEPRPEAHWRLRPWGADAVVTFLTSPVAATVAPPTGLTLTHLGPAPGGFATYRVEPK